LLRYFLNDFEMVPVAPIIIINAVNFVLTYYHHNHHHHNFSTTELLMTFNSSD